MNDEDRKKVGAFFSSVSGYPNIAKAWAEHVKETIKTHECSTHDKTRKCHCRCHGKARMKHTVAFEFRKALQT